MGRLGIVAHTFNSSPWEAKVKEILCVCEFEASLIYIVSSRPAKAIF